jgi:hypothetical protein
LGANGTTLEAMGDFALFFAFRLRREDAMDRA